MPLIFHVAVCKAKISLCSPNSDWLIPEEFVKLQRINMVPPDCQFEYFWLEL